MSKRHQAAPGDWVGLAARLDELIRTHSGEDPFEEAWKLLVARLVFELEGSASPFLGAPPEEPSRELAALLGRAGRRWPRLLDGHGASRLGAAELRRAAELLSRVRLLDDDLVGLDAVFEGLVARAAKGAKGQFFTPRHVVAEVIAMVAPRAGETVVDPACGSGAFLRHALAHTPDCRVLGFDQDPRAVQVARTLLAASGQPCARITRADSLLRGEDGDSPPIEAAGAGLGEPAPFDVIVTNPPFAGDVGGAFRGTYTLAGAGRVERDVLFLERCVGLLRPGGRLAIVLPHNKVGGAAWAGVRAWLLRQARVVAVLALGRETFLPHTSQKAAVVIAVRRPRPLDAPRPDERVVFFVSDRSGKDALGRLVRRPDPSGAVDHDLAEAREAVRAGLAEAGA
jgi:type I restriction enzyme M protein